MHGNRVSSSLQRKTQNEGSFWVGQTPAFSAGGRVIYYSYCFQRGQQCSSRHPRGTSPHLTLCSQPRVALSVRIFAHQSPHNNADSGVFWSLHSLLQKQGTLVSVDNQCPGTSRDERLAPRHTPKKNSTKTIAHFISIAKW